MANLLLPMLIFSEILSSLAMAGLAPSPARLSHREPNEEAEAMKAPPLRLLLPLCPSSAPETAQHPRSQASKMELAAAKVIAAAFIAACVVATVVYIRVTRKRAAENSKY